MRKWDAGGDLFDFGNRDGAGDDARFQPPLGVCCWNGQVFLADTYNHAIKAITPQTRDVRSLSDGLLNEPGGVSAAQDVLIVADTNHHRIQMYHYASAHWETLAIHQLCAPDVCVPLEFAKPLEKLNDN